MSVVRVTCMLKSEQIESRASAATRLPLHFATRRNGNGKAVEYTEKWSNLEHPERQARRRNCGEERVVHRVLAEPARSWAYILWGGSRMRANDQMTLGSEEGRCCLSDTVPDQGSDMCLHALCAVVIIIESRKRSSRRTV